MEYVWCKYKNRYRFEKAYNVNEFDMIKHNFISVYNEKHKYIETPITFDIETSTIYDEVKSLKENKPIYEGYMYHAQLCIEGYVFFMRTWREVQYIFEKIIQHYELDKQHKIACYIHNLSYEFQFLYRFFDVSNVFATAKHKVLKCVLNECIELRCSYYLSNMNLLKFIENTPTAIHFKATGDIDHRIVRTPKSYLNIVEKGYCYNDVLGLYEAIMYLLNDDTLKSIPLTSTGYVRRDCRNAMRKNRANRKKFELSKLDIDTYNLLKRAFRGGDTASSRYMVNQILENVSSYDFSSSYPFVMISEKFPTGKFMKASIIDEKELIKYNYDYCTVGVYHFKNIRQKKTDVIPYIPYAKCEGISNHQNFNGRIITADFLTIPLTNIDWQIINETYEYDELYIDDFYFSRKAPLPKEFINIIMKFFYLKSLLKNDPEKAYEYMKSKNKLNALFGMLVTDILHDEFSFTAENLWTIIENRTQEQLDSYYKGWNSFLTYQWGVWVTAYARYNLYQARKIVGIDMVYQDTDSVKFIGNYQKEFKNFNDKILKKCQQNGIINYVDVDGKRIYMGLMDYEGVYDSFITMGAKKYAYEKNGKLGLTVSGLSKVKGAKELERKGGLKYFRQDEIFHDSGRTVAYYNDDNVHYITVNGVKILTASNIALVETTYTLGMTDTMRSILDNL